MSKDEAKPHILLVEDARDIREPLARYLREHGYRATTAADAASARKVMKGAAIDLVVLDIMMPGEDGLSLCRSLRETSQIPVVLLTARGEEVDRIIGLEIGADDYVAKPFSPREVSARVRTILRRYAKGQAPAAAPVGFELDEARACVHFAGHKLNLTRYEYLLLKTLLAEPGRVFSRQQLMERVWRDAEDSFDRTVDTHVKTLRAKLRDIDPNAQPIQTHRGLGYSLSL
jgi:two-component system catabolic regulation response regulator CreB